MKGLITGSLAAIAVFSGAGAVSAQKVKPAAAEAGINPDCTKFGKQARACTCALETGGMIRPDGRWHYNDTPRWTGCMQQKGWM